VVTLNFTSWNRVVSWLQAVDEQASQYPVVRMCRPPGHGRLMRWT
jgi:hypothetical protein